MTQVINYKQNTANQMAQQALRHLMDGNPPNDIKPEECGDWASLVAILYETYERGGTVSVKKHLLGEVTNEDLMTLLAEDFLNEDSQPESGDNSETSLNGVQFITWADMRKEFQSITWAWEPWLGNGLLTIIAGEPGAGKSLFTLVGIVKPFLIGAPWPDGTKYTGEIGKALWIETEGGQSINLDRAEEFSLPMDQIISVILNDGTVDLSIDNQQHWKLIVNAAMRDDVRVIVLDSLSGGHSQDENSAAMLRVVKPLALLARSTGKPVIATHHLNKLYVPPGEIPSVRHVRGSTTIIQPARVVWTVDVPNTNNQDVKRLAMIKNNLGTRKEPITYVVTDEGIELSSTPQPIQRLTKQEQATQFLRSELADGSVPSAQMEDLLASKGLLDAAKKVKATLGVISVSIDGVWHWQLAQED